MRCLPDLEGQLIFRGGHRWSFPGSPKLLIYHGKPYQSGWFRGYPYLRNPDVQCGFVMFVCNLSRCMPRFHGSYALGDAKLQAALWRIALESQWGWPVRLLNRKMTTWICHLCLKLVYTPFHPLMNHHFHLYFPGISPWICQCFVGYTLWVKLKTPGPTRCRCWKRWKLAAWPADVKLKPWSCQARDAGFLWFRKLRTWRFAKLLRSIEFLSSIHFPGWHRRAGSFFLRGHLSSLVRMKLVWRSSHHQWADGNDSFSQQCCSQRTALDCFGSCMPRRRLHWSKNLAFMTVFGRLMEVWCRRPDQRFTHLFTHNLLVVVCSRSRKDPERRNILG